MIWRLLEVARRSRASRARQCDLIGAGLNRTAVGGAAIGIVPRSPVCKQAIVNVDRCDPYDR